jgi:hypothetical protein
MDLSCVVLGIVLGFVLAMILLRNSSGATPEPSNIGGYTVSPNKKLEIIGSLSSVVFPVSTANNLGSGSKFSAIQR